MTRWQHLPALADDERHQLVDRARRLRRLIPPRYGIGQTTRELDELARCHGVTLRTLYRYLRAAS